MLNIATYELNCPCPLLSIPEGSDSNKIEYILQTEA